MITLRTAGSAHRGLGEWLVQRLSALYLAGFLLWFLACMLLSSPADYPAWKAWFAGGGVRLAFAVFFLSVLLHAWAGMRSVLLDYLKPLGMRFTVQVLAAAGLLAMAFWAMQILLVEGVR